MFCSSLLNSIKKVSLDTLSKNLRRNYHNMSYIQPPGSGHRKEVTLIPGKFIGPEVVDSVVEIFEAAKCPVDFQVIDKFDFNNTSHRQKLRQNKAILLGNLGRSAQ